MREERGEVPPPTTGAQFGKYRIVRRIGQGAFGSVYEAVQPGAMGFAKQVAIKRLRSHLSGPDSPFVKALVNEARIGGLLHNANIVDILEFDQVGPHYYLAMEYIDGVTLSEIVDLCRRRKILLPRFAVVDIAMQVCRGLQYAHEQCDRDGRPLDLIHRDLKPSNIMVDRGGTAKICDFGIAKAASNLFNETATGFTKGTPRYMSPDQLRDLKPLLPRSDVFSLGVVLYELVTARPLFAAESVPALTHQIVFSDFQDRLREAEEAFPGAGQVLDRTLRRVPEERIQTAEELGEAFRALGRRYPPEAELSRVIARLVQAVDRTESREIRSSGDLDFDASDARGLSEEPIELDDADLSLILAPAADSSGWTRFTHAFPSGVTATGAAAELSPSSSGQSAESDPQRGSVRDGPLSAAEPTGTGPGTPGRRRAAFGIALTGAVLLGLLAVILVSVVAVWALNRVNPGSVEPQATGVDSLVESQRGDEADARSATAEGQQQIDGEPREQTPTGSPDDAADDAARAVQEDPRRAEPEREEPRGQDRPVDDGFADENDADGEEHAENGPGVQPPAPDPGELSFFVKPCWAQVYLDGTYLGGIQRPGKPIAVAGGAHTLRLVCDHEQCPAGHVEKVFSLWIDGVSMRVDGAAVSSGKCYLCWDFETGAFCD